MKRCPYLIAAAMFLSSLVLCTPRAAGAQTTILTPAEASWAEVLAGREIRRYVYVRTSKLLPLRSAAGGTSRGDVIVVARRDHLPLMAGADLAAVAAEARALEPQCYLVKTWQTGRQKRLVVTGGDDAGVLYGAYRLAEILGVRFYLDGDVIPDTRVPWQIPDVEEHGRPLFRLRGIQPFHDFPEGPDWWNRDDYLAIIGQLAKLRMNFIGLHTYPEERPNAEPTVWIGVGGDAQADGRVRFSYPSSYMSTLRGNWGYLPRKTRDYLFGSADLFERDDFGPDVMADFLPAPTTPESCNEVFDRTASLLCEAFGFARRLGVKTCVGTETPLVVPKLVRERLKRAGKDPSNTAVIRELYEGIFRRAANAYPLDYYWFWSPEGWTWSGTKDEEVTAATNDLFAAIAAHRAVQPPFALATCGWVLGPQQDRALFDKVLPKEIAVSCINREVGKTPVEPGFAEVRGRSKWAIPWMEDDPALSSPQLWAGRMRRDAADALRYGCDGLMGIHWRTRVLGPNIGALAQAAWTQKPWVHSYKPEPQPVQAVPLASGAIGGNVASFPNAPITGTDEPEIYRTVRYNLTGYHLGADNGPCRVTLKFCEPHYDAPGKRVFDVKLQGVTVITNLDILARVGKNRALDFVFEHVPVTNGWVDVRFVPRTEFPSIAALVVEGANFTNRVNCGGPAWGPYAADDLSAPPPKQVYAATADFYADWARAQFGPAVAERAAAIFERIDCRLPVPSFWVKGPGGVQPDDRPWATVSKDYSFVDEFVALDPQVRGAGNRERFEYWKNTFLYLRDIGRLNCTWGELSRALARAKGATNADATRDLARELVLPRWADLLQALESVYGHLLATVSTPGEMGTVMNWNQHNLPDVLEQPAAELAKLMGKEAIVPKLAAGAKYRGPLRIIVPTKRTSLQAGERLSLKVIILAEEPVREATIHWRELGRSRFHALRLDHVSRGVYQATLPSTSGRDFEYYVAAIPRSGKAAYFPPTAPDLNQTIVVCAE